MNDDYVNDPTQGWSLMTDSTPGSGEARANAPRHCLRFVAKASTAHEVPVASQSEQRTSPDVRMMRAAIK